MRRVPFVVLAALAIALMILGVSSVTARSQILQTGPGGGMIRGQVLGFDMNDELQPIDWAAVYANNGQQTFKASTGGGGFYEMYVPTGMYNVTVVEPGYKPYSAMVAVANGSTSTINIYLEQSHVPVPEFPVGMATILTLAALSAALLAMRRVKRKR